MNVYVFIYTYVRLDTYASIYIYIYIYTELQQTAGGPRVLPAPASQTVNTRNEESLLDSEDVLAVIKD